VLTKNEFYAVQSEQFVDETFEGSLPAFIAAFTQRKGISQQEAAEIRHMIDAAAGKE
jgi:BlaI family penicillinase repressor